MLELSFSRGFMPCLGCRNENLRMTLVRQFSVRNAAVLDLTVFSWLSECGGQSTRTVPLLKKRICALRASEIPKASFVPTIVSSLPLYGCPPVLQLFVSIHTLPAHQHSS